MTPYISAFVAAAWVSALVALGATSVGAQTDRGPAGSTRQDARVESFDRWHPANFVRIAEAYGSGAARAISEPRGRSRGCDAASDRSVRERIDTEVDAESRIRIEFDRQWLYECKIDGVLLIRAWARSGDTPREIEVKGYSEVGKERAPAPSLVRGRSELDGVLGQLRVSARWVAAAIERFVSTVEGRSLQAERTATAVGARVVGLQSEREAAIRALAATEAALAETRRDTITAADTLVARRERELTTARARADSLEREIAEARARQAAAGQLSSFSPADVDKLRLELQGERTIINSIVGRLSDNASPLLRQIAQLAVFDAPTLAALAGEFQNVLATLDASVGASQEQRDAFAFRAAHVGLVARRLVAALDTADKSLGDGGVGLTPVFLRDVRDADVHLGATGLRAGDVLILEISDSIPDVNVKRVFTVRMRVEQLGWSRTIADAAMLLYRGGVTTGSVRQQVRSARAQFVATGNPEPVEVPLPSNFAPAAGASLVWTYRERHEKTFFHILLRALTPGVGVNVSFTSFPEQSVTFSKAEQAGAPPVETVTPAKTDVQVAVGPVVTLFDNRLMLGTGWNLNVEQKRFYYSVGFSFVNIAKRFGLSGGDAVTR